MKSFTDQEALLCPKGQRYQDLQTVFWWPPLFSKKSVKFALTPQYPPGLLASSAALMGISAENHTSKEQTYKTWLVKLETSALLQGQYRSQRGLIYLPK